MNKFMEAFAPGRTEIAGNHVDHQHGIAVTGSLEQGISAKVELRDDFIIKIESEGFEPFSVDLVELKEEPVPNAKYRFTSKSLVAGVAYSFIKKGININGFTAKVSSTIGSGMGLSSSAAFELLIGVILNEAYNEGNLSKMELAQIGQFAEVEFYGKPCGLLDQTAISYGGIISIDFSNPKILQVEPINFSFEENNIAAVLVDSGAEHGDISHMYASIPEEMKKVANLCGVDFLADTNIENLKNNILSEKLSNRSAIRAIHYFHEINLVKKRIEAMKNNDGALFMYLHGLSGSSSAQFLQNVTVSEDNQQATLCQAICELCLDITSNNFNEARGASRIHGGGFGGCIQVFLPKPQVEAFKDLINTIYKKNVASEIAFSKNGAYARFL